MPAETDSIRAASSSGTLTKVYGGGPRHSITGPVNSISTRSAALPDRGPLLGEGSGALDRVLGGEDRTHQLVLLLPRLLARPVAGRAGDLARHLDGERALRRDRARELQSPLESAALVREPVDQPELVSAGRVDGLSGEQ